MSVDYAIMERRSELQKFTAATAGPPPIAALAVQRFHPWMKTLEASGFTRSGKGRISI